MNPQIMVFNSGDELCTKAAERIIEIGNKAIVDHGNFSLALSGGKTPKQVYQAIGAIYKDKIDWTKVHLFWGDERDVIKTHADSNYGMAKEALIDHVPIPSTNIHRIGTEEDAMLAAQQSEDDIREFFGIYDGGFPKFDLILLGLGEDGHTASLFPGSDGIQETKALMMDNYVKKLGTHRVTMTFPVINHAFNVIFLVSGASKASMVKQVIQGTAPEILPSQMVRPSGQLYWLLDKDAASELS